VPIILFGVDYWTKFSDFLRSAMIESHHTIEEHEMDIFTITDDPGKVVEIVKSIRTSGWWNVMD
jgi:predicted Rossmann-fold nucleotide-binding protein